MKKSKEKNLCFFFSSSPYCCSPFCLVCIGRRSRARRSSGSPAASGTAGFEFYSAIPRERTDSYLWGSDSNGFLKSNDAPVG